MHLVLQCSLHPSSPLTTDISASLSYPHFVSRVPRYCIIRYSILTVSRGGMPPDPHSRGRLRCLQQLRSPGMVSNPLTVFWIRHYQVITFSFLCFLYRPIDHRSIETDRQTDADRPTDRQTDRQTERQSYPWPELQQMFLQMMQSLVLFCFCSE